MAGTAAAGFRNALVATCALAALYLIAFGGISCDWSREEIVRDNVRGTWVPMSALFLLLTTYFSLPFGISRSSSFQHGRTCFVAATIIGFLMPTVIAINNPASFPPRLVNTEGLKQTSRQSLSTVFHLSQPELPPRRMSDEHNILRIRPVDCTLCLLFSKALIRFPECRGGSESTVYHKHSVELRRGLQFTTVASRSNEGVECLFTVLLQPIAVCSGGFQIARSK
jgi:hypothetical protein